MALNIGINVLETDGTTAPALAGAPTSVAGLVVRSRRGPAGGTVRASKFADFLSRFGGHHPSLTSSYGVEGFFGNGGQEAHVARVVGEGAAAARVTLKDRGDADTLRLAAGYRGQEDPGAWGNELWVDVRDNPRFSTRLAATRTGQQPARLQGEALAASLDLSVVAPAPARRLRLDVDDPAVQLPVVFDPSTVPVITAVSREDIARAINAQAGGRVSASVNANGVLIVSRTKGAASRVIAAAGVDDATRTLLGFPAGNTQADGAAAPAGAYTEVQVQGLAGFQLDEWVRLSDGVTTNWHQVTGLVQRDDGSGNFDYFVSFAAPAAGDQNQYRTEDGSTLSTVEFDLVVKQAGPADARPRVVETWEKLTLDPAAPNYAPARVNAPFSGSAYVTATDLDAGTFDGRDIPRVVENVRLGLPTPATSTWVRTPGSDGTAPSTTAYVDALARFDTLGIQLLSLLEDVPDGVLMAFTRAAVDYCANKGDCLFVGHTPAGRDLEGAKAFGQELRAAKVYGALYWPWIRVSDPLGGGSAPLRSIPPTGHVLGVYARTDQTRGVWKAPAGNEAVVRGALAVERDVTDGDHTDLVKNGSVNGIRRLPGVGVVLDASRTLSTDNRWQYVNVRLLFNYVKASLRDGLRWVKQEPNREALWSRIKYNAVTPFLMRLFQEGAFGPGKPADVFTVIVGPENNPPQEVALGNLKIEVYFFPSRPAETVLIVVGQQDSGASAAEA